MKLRLPQFDATRPPLAGPHEPYVVRLLLPAPVTLDAQRLLQTVREVEPDASLRDGEPLCVQLEPGAGASATLTALDRVSEPEQVEAALNQTWDWPNARESVQHAQAELVIRDAAAHALGRRRRLRFVHALLRAAFEQTPVLALHWMPSQRIVHPEAYRESVGHGAPAGDTAINVRLFRIPDGKPGEMLMDTLGLAALGLPDLQCHFTGLNPGDVAPLLFAYAEYLFDKGDVLNDDSMVRGIHDQQEWVVHREESLAPPARDVVDIRPDGHWVEH